MSVTIALSAYAALLLGVALQAGLSFAFYVVVLGVLPLIALFAWYSEEFAPVTGLVTQKTLDEATRAVREREKEAFRQLQAQEGGESMEWLNFLLERMWPHIAKFGEETILGLEETIQKQVPVPGGIRFKTCSLGREPIRFGPITPRVVSSYYDDKFVEEGGVELQIGLTYHSDVEIILATKFATVGVASLDITGTLSVLFCPLVNKAPFFGGMQILFTNPPKVDVDFRGIGNLADMPGIYSTVRKLIDDAIAGVMVMPNRIAKPIADDSKVDLARLKNPPPEGVLSIRVVRAEKLEGKDFGLVKQTSDPYVQIKVGSESFKTPTVMRTCDPVWEQDNFSDFVIYSAEQCVQVDVFDWDRVGADDPLGSINQMPVRRLIAEYAGKGVQPWRLEPRSAGEDPPPEEARLHLEVQWFWLAERLEGPELKGPDVSGCFCGPQLWWHRGRRQRDPQGKYLLSFKIDECTGLPQQGLGGPFTVRMSLKGTESSRETSAGWSKWSSTATPKTLDSIRMLDQSGVKSSVIAEVVDVNVELIEEFLRDQTGSQTSEEWLQKLQSSCTERERSCNPQFEEVLSLKLATREAVVVVELINDPKQRPKTKKGEAPNDVVARFELPLGHKEVLDGPFTLSGAAAESAMALGGSAQLHGTFTLSRLEVASPKLEKWRAVNRMLMTRAHAGGPRRGSEAAAASASASASASSPAGAGGSPGRPRKRDKLMGAMAKVFGGRRCGSQEEQAAEAAAASGEASPSCGSPAAGAQSQKAQPPRVEQAVDLIQGAALAAALDPAPGRSGAAWGDALCGLGVLRGERDWAQALHVYARKYGGAAGKGDLLAALDQAVPDEERPKVARMLLANGIGSGDWPPPRRPGAGR